jgi:hypothetical protein
MEQEAPIRLPYRREIYRLWFEYLRVAKKSERQDVKDALKRSASFYAPWGDVLAERFDVWWKDHRKLFEDTQTVRRLERGEVPSDPDTLIVQIPMTQSPTILTKQVKKIIQEAFAETARATKKLKRQAQSLYCLTEGAEPKLLAVRESLTVYRDVQLKHPKLHGQVLLDEVRAFYRRRKNKKWAKIPGPFSDVGYEADGRGQRNLLRYCKRAEAIMLNVANRHFPGKY